MEEFELMPNDTTMGLMRGEYNKVFHRGEILKGCEDKKECKCNDKCGCSLSEAKKMTKAYFIEEDMIVALRKLYSLSQREFREEIKDIISIKRKNSKLLLEMFANKCNDTVDYAPNLVNNKKFCVQLQEICRMQHSLLCALNDMPICNNELNRIINSELMVSCMLNRLELYCKLGFNY